MKNILYIAVVALSFNTFAVGLIPQALCTGTVMEETGDGNPPKKLNIKVSSQVNPNNECVEDQTKIDTSAAIVIQNEVNSGNLIEDTASILTAVMSTSAIGETVFTSTDSDGYVITMKYTVTSFPGEAQAVLTGVDETPIILECVLPHFMQSCDLVY